MKYFKIIYILISFVIAFVISKFFKNTRGYKEFTVIGTRNGQRGQDNAEYFHDYLLSQNVDAKIIYNNASSSNGYELKKNSICCIIAILNAKKIYITHSESDLLDYWWRLFPHLKVNFIQHGVIGVKSLPDYEIKNYHTIVVSNCYEEKIISQNYNYNPDNIIKTGIARFDYYDVVEPSLTIESINDCLVMFTWRDNIDDRRKQFIEYESIISALLRSSPQLKIKLCIHDANHGELQHRISLLSKDYPNVEVISSDKLSAVITTVPLLVTDYSSIAWDFLYQNKFILFYTYDIEDYKKNIGLYCDFKKFFGAHMMTLDNPEISLIPWVIEENILNNARFLESYPFYYHGKKTHREMMYAKITKN